MALDWGAGAIIRAGSGLVYIAAGWLAFKLSNKHERERPTLQGLGWLAIGVGVFLVPRNLAYGFEDSWVAGLAGVTMVLAGLVHTGAAGWLAVRSRPAMRWWLFSCAATALLLIGALAVGPSQVAAVGLPPSLAWTFVFGTLLQGLTLLFAGAWALQVASSLETGSRHFTALAVATVAVLAYFEGIVGDTAANGRRPFLVLLAFAFAMIPIVVAGALHANRRRRAAGYVLMLGPYSYAFLAALWSLAWPSTEINPTSPALGIMRSFAAGVLAYSLLRYAATQRETSTKSRATWAAAALAILFIVAQVMQNFLSAEYGLLTGGIIAGSVLFAANPIQRAIERATQRSGEGAPKVGKVPEEAYKSAVRLALRGGITRAEELELARIADAHGIRAVRAHELRDEVERGTGGV